MKFAATLLVGSALAFGANASTVSYSFSNPLQTPEISQTGNLGLFDSSLGTLTGASLTFHGSGLATLNLTNNASSSQTVRATSTTDLFFNSTLAGLDALIALSNPLVSLSETTGLQTLLGGASASFGPLSATGFIAWTAELSGIIGSFEQVGGGNFGIGCNSRSGFALEGGGGNISTGQSTTAACGADITYTYDAPVTQVPEPASMALVGLGLLGLVMSHRRARKD